MIFRDKILIQLHRKEASFHDFDGSLLDESKTYKELLGRLAELSSAELSAQLNGPTPGALPTALSIVKARLMIGWETPARGCESVVSSFKAGI